MTNLYPNSSVQNTAGEGAGQPGGAPVGTTMQGNPQESQFQPNGVQPPGPMFPTQQLLPTQISNGQVPLHTQPTTSNLAPGTDSLLAMLSRGQIMKGDSLYGQSAFMPPNGGAGPQVQQSGTPSTVTRVASGVTIANPPIYTGN